jgi:cephalosporin hydroxylase
VAEPSVTDAFHRLYYDTAVWKDTYWLGVRAQKCPLDLWVYQKILYEQRPELILETGTAHGGSALYLAPPSWVRSAAGRRASARAAC